MPTEDINSCTFPTTPHAVHIIIEPERIHVINICRGRDASPSHDDATNPGSSASQPRGRSRCLARNNTFTHLQLIPGPHHRNGLCVGVLLAILHFNGKAHFPLTLCIMSAVVSVGPSWI